MATKLNYDATHAVAFPSKLKSQMCGHVYNVKLTSDADNGAIIGRVRCAIPMWELRISATITVRNVAFFTH